MWSVVLTGVMPRKHPSKRITELHRHSTRYPTSWFRLIFGFSTWVICWLMFRVTPGLPGFTWLRKNPDHPWKHPEFGWYTLRDWCEGSTDLNIESGIYFTVCTLQVLVIFVHFLS